MQNQYFPLPAQNSIRLIKIRPGDRLDAIHCELVVVEDLKTAPPYEALSYAWGDVDVTTPITCNGITTAVTTNLASALRRLRWPSAPATTRESDSLVGRLWSPYNTLRRKSIPSYARRVGDNDGILASSQGFIWIDALCINQLDIAERSAQVSIMRSIYKSASRVIVWLGDDIGRTESALKVISIGLDCYYKERPCGQEKYLPKRETVTQNHHRLWGFPPFNSPSWVALQEFFGLSWFSRVWVIQEVVASSSCVMIIKNLELDWPAIGRATYWMSQKGYSLVDIPGDCIENPTLLWQLYANANVDPSTLLDLIVQTRGFHSTLPQDKVYSLLGIAKETEDRTVRSPDYSRPASDLYRDIVKSIIRERQDLLIFSFVDHGDELTGQEPSWVLDENVIEMNFEDSNFTEHGSDGGKSLTFLSAPGSDLISVNGIIFDRISCLGDAMIDCDDFSDKAPPKQAWDKLKEKLNKTPTDHMLGLSIGINFTLTLTSGRDWWGRPAAMNAQYYEDAAAFWNHVGALDLKLECQRRVSELSQNNETKIKKNVGDLAPFYSAMAILCRNRRLFITKKGYVGVGPRAVHVGDDITVLFGGSTPFVLRPEKERYRLVGECYIHNIKDGEAVEQWERDGLPPHTFEIF